MLDGNMIANELLSAELAITTSYPTIVELQSLSSQVDLLPYFVVHAVYELRYNGFLNNQNSGIVIYHG